MKKYLVKNFWVSCGKPFSLNGGKAKNIRCREYNLLWMNKDNDLRNKVQNIRLAVK